MASNINLKRSSVSGKTPSVDNLSLGELGVNTYDGKIFLKQDQGGVGVGTTVITVNPWGVGVGSTAYDTYFTVGNVGIGLTNPTTLFEVNGDVRVGGALTSVGGFNIGIQTGGTDVTTGVVTALNFIGAGNTLTYNPATKTVDITIAASEVPFSRTVNDFTATSGQTTFAVTYTVGYVDVYVNGVYLDSSEYTATSGSSVVLNVGANNGDTVSIITYVTRGTLAVSGGSDRTKTLTIAGAGQTQFSVDYTSDGYLDVYLNGSKLNTNEYSATNGTTVGLNSATALNDELEFIVYNPIYNDAIWTASNPGYGNTSNIYRQFGNVGIGTTNAQTSIHVASTAPYIRIQDTDSFIAADAQGGFEMYDGDGDRLFFLANDDAASPDVSLFNNAGGSLKFGTSGIERVRIDSSGRFLVGISTNRANWFNSSSWGGPLIQIESATDTNSAYSVVNASNNGNAPLMMFGKTRGGVIGNTIVQEGDSCGQISFFGNDGSEMVESARIIAFVDGTPGADDMPGRIVFSTTADGASSPTERMRITKAGPTKMTTDGNYYSSTSPQHEHYQSNNGWYNTVFTSSASPNPYGLAIVFTGASPDNNTETFLDCIDSTATRMKIYSDGDVWTSDAGTLTSDVTLKRDITDASPKLADVMNLRVRNFYWEEDYHPNKQDKKLIGFIAQEFEEVFPGLVSEHKINGGDPILDEDGNETGEKTPEVFKKGIKEAKLIPILVKALQESVERIETLEAKVAALETQHQQAIETLEDEVAVLEDQQPSS